MSFKGAELYIQELCTLHFVQYWLIVIWSFMKVSWNGFKLQSGHDFVTTRRPWQQKPRTSGPVNAQLTPGHGIYFNAFILVYSPWAGADNPLGTNVVGQQRALITSCPFKTMSTRFFMFFHRYIAPGYYGEYKGHTNPWPYHFAHLLQVLKKKKGQTMPWDQNFYLNRKALSLRLFVAN